MLRIRPSLLILQPKEEQPMNKLTTIGHRGFSVVEVLVIIAIVGVIGGAGFYVFSRQSDDSAKNDETSQVASDDVPEITSAEGLDAADQTLDDTDLDAMDAELESLDAELAEI